VLAPLNKFTAFSTNNLLVCLNRNGTITAHWKKTVNDFITCAALLTDRILGRTTLDGGHMQPRFNENEKEPSPNLTLSRPMDLPVTMFQSDLYPSLMRIMPAGAPCEDYGKMFPDLPFFDEGEDEDDVIERLRTLGRKSGPMDALDPRVTVTNPLDSNDQGPDARNPDKTNIEMSVGFTFLGQFPRP
jgi:hypothetical protein